MKHDLSLYEQETIINFNEEEKIAYVFTYNETWQKRLEVQGFEAKKDNGWGGKEYVLGKSLIRCPHVLSQLQLDQRCRASPFVPKNITVPRGKKV